jgi:hypothetical protein
MPKDDRGRGGVSKGVFNHLSVDEKFSMRTPKVTKKFRFLYNKGAVHDDGTITSFYN